MQNIKIEYVNNVLVSLEHNGVSYTHLPVSSIHFDHTAKIFPHLKIEIEAGGAPYTPTAPSQPPAAVEGAQPAKEGELLPPDDIAPQPPRRPRHRNRNRNRSQ
ncbi:hypothetical protein [Klebsiella aerogenes]|uniref:hypothetical protein n=1 Tax=Klebsiella aerogenes TaxID=548 RepID=UPI000B420834|nr:hypothetical protein [Klebsiella aerogenes]RNT24692.1 hypothetical protein B9031_017450 [Klebsiella aerogenes]